MAIDDEHYAVNRADWDERAPAHADSADYVVREIIADPTACLRHQPTRMHIGSWHECLG